MLQIAKFCFGHGDIFQDLAERTVFQFFGMQRNNSASSITVEKDSVCALGDPLRETCLTEFTNNFFGLRRQRASPQHGQLFWRSRIAHRFDRSIRATQFSQVPDRFRHSGFVHRSQTATRAFPRALLWSSRARVPSCLRMSEHRAPQAQRLARLLDQPGLETTVRCMFSPFYPSTEVMS